MKSIDEIYQDMLEVYSEQTGYDMSDSADLAVRLLAAAAEIGSLYVNADWILRQAFPQTAQGVYLEYHAAARGISRLSSSYAEGYLRFYIDSPLTDDLTIPVGTVCMTAGLISFETVEKGVIYAGALQAYVHVRAQTAGSSGNVRAGSVVLMSLPPVGVSGCTNVSAFSGGEDGESDEQLRLRILDTYVRLPNGANSAYYANVAITIPGVEAVSVIPRVEGIGTVGVVVAVAPGYTTETVLDAVREELGARREIGVDVYVSEAVLEPVTVAAEIALAEGYSWHVVKVAVESAIAKLFDAGLLGKPLLIAALGRVVYEVEGVTNYRIVSPASDVTADAFSLPVLSKLTISEMEG